MNTHSLAALALTFAFFSTSGCDEGKKGKGGDRSTSKESDETKSEEGGAKKKKGAAKTGCKLKDERITADVTLDKGCQLELDHNVVVGGGATLTILAGAQLSFAPGQYLHIEDGKLLAKGTAKEPVTFTSRNSTKAPGDWVGLFFSADTMSGTRIEHTRIEYAGQESSMGQGAVTINGGNLQKRVAFVNTHFNNNSRAGIFVEGDKGAFAEFADNRFESNKISLSAPAEVLGSIGKGNSFGDPVETWGRVGESASWPAFGAPVLVKSSLTIGSTSATPTLTLANGTTLKFAPGHYLSVGEDTGGSLVAPGCTFTSSAESPQAGDWIGMFVYKLTQRLDLVGASIEAAGNDGHGGRAAITFYDVNAKDARNVNLSGLTVKNTKSGALASPDNDCGPLAAQLAASDVPACRPE